MDEIERLVRERGLALPASIAAPPGVTLQLALVMVAGNLAYVSGHGPADGSRRLARGRVGDDVGLEDAQAAARLCALAMLSSLKQELGTLDRVQSWVSVTGFVRCTPDFEQTPAVLNGFSELICELWPGPAGRHARSAIGVTALPFAVPVEVAAVVQIV